MAPSATSRFPTPPRQGKCASERILYSDSDSESSSDDVDKIIPRTPTITQPTLIPSKATLSTQPTQLLPRAGLTQPTQIVNKSTLAGGGIPSGVASHKSPFLSSPPPPPPHGSDVEVPVSSPFRDQSARVPSPVSKRTTLGNRIAPAGTTFRPPQSQPQSQPQPQFFPPARRPQQSAVIKHSVPEPITLSSDEENESSPRRADITRINFARKMSVYKHPGSTATENGVNGHAKKHSSASAVSSKNFSSNAPSKNAFSRLMDRAKDRTDKENTAPTRRTHSSGIKRSVDVPEVPERALSSPRRRRRLVQGVRPRFRSSSDLSSDTSSSSDEDDPVRIRKSAPSRRTCSPSPGSKRGVDFLDEDDDSPPRRRRRLVRGARPHDDSPDPLAAEPGVIVIDDDTDDDEDGAKMDSDEDDEDEGVNDKLLKFLNTGTVEDISAVSKRDRADIEAFLAKAPFASVTAARRVVNRKASASRSSRAHLGELLVAEVREFIDATNAIDIVVADCEAKARTIRRHVGRWDIDMFGRKRGRVDGDDKSGGDGGGGGGDDEGSRDTHEYAHPPIKKQPAMMDGHCRMKNFQHYGLNWMNLCYKNKFGCILADEMGLGKTCQVISLMCHLAESAGEDGGAGGNGKVPWPNLIVVPPSTYSNWLAEFERFAPELSVAGYQGGQDDRLFIGEEILESRSAYHVVLTTYTQLGSEGDMAFLMRLRPNVAVFDEGHKMKNPKTKAYRSLMQIPAGWRMLLTGTPVQNNLLEMISLLRFVNPDLFRGRMEQLNYIFNSKVSVRDLSNGAFLHAERVLRARTILEPFILQRRKQQVVEMPAKVHRVEYCDLTPTQRPIYDEYEAAFRNGPAQRPSRGGGRGTDQNNVWMQLRKAAIHPQLFRRFFTDRKIDKIARILMDKVPQEELQQPHLHHLVGELANSSDFEVHLWCRDYAAHLADFDVDPGSDRDSGKVVKLLELIEQYKKNGDRVLVFSKFARVLDILEEVLCKEGMAHCKLSGATDVAERQDIINAFNSDPSIPVFLLTTAAGGTGINLAAANKVVIFDQSDNPQEDIQAENRAHRLGQTREVEVVRLVARGTIEELILKACDKKIELANRVTGSLEEPDAGTQQKNLEAEVRKMMVAGGLGGEKKKNKRGAGEKKKARGE